LFLNYKDGYTSGTLKDIVNENAGTEILQ